MVVDLCSHGAEPKSFWTDVAEGWFGRKRAADPRPRELRPLPIIDVRTEPLPTSEQRGDDRADACGHVAPLRLLPTIDEIVVRRKRERVAGTG